MEINTGNNGSSSLLGGFSTVAKKVLVEAVGAAEVENVVSEVAAVLEKVRHRKGTTICTAIRCDRQRDAHGC